MESNSKKKTPNKLTIDHIISLRVFNNYINYKWEKIEQTKLLYRLSSMYMY